MCGIFAILNNNNENKVIEKEFKKGNKRGPEFSIMKSYNNLVMGFHRLAINGLNENSNQPFDMHNIVLICNGEIYNYQTLAKEHNLTMNTNSDCEIILHMYRLYGLNYTLNILDGVFSFILYDKNINKVFVARDPYGVRPLYYFINNNTYCFASELKVLYNLVDNKSLINNFIPGNFMTINNNESPYYNLEKYTNFPCSNNNYFIDSNNEVFLNIVLKLSNAVKKRVQGTTERPIACLLSGGLDSSLIACLVNKHMKNIEGNEYSRLKTFSIGLAGSEDLKYAAIVAKHIDSDHNEIIVSEEEFFNAIPNVIRVIESYDTTTIRASVGNYLVAKYIKENSDCKVIFNGDGADELMGGYLYFTQAPNAYEFDYECKRLLNDIYMYDVLRSDKSISSNGLEPRTPFLDRQWVEFYLSINKHLRFDTTCKSHDKCEKFLIRKAFEKIMPKLLPHEILWRKKEAFSDGVSSLNKSWYQIIQEKISENISLHNNIDNLIETYKNDDNLINKPNTYEQGYYRLIYNKYYKNTDHLIKYYWMPKYVDANDASARTLKIY